MTDKEKIADLEELLAEAERERDEARNALEGFVNGKIWRSAESCDKMLAELRKRMGEAEKAAHIQGQIYAYEQAAAKCMNRSVDSMAAGMPAVMTGELESRYWHFRERAEALRKALASPPSPAPVDENGCRHVDGICAKVGFPGHVKPEDF